MTNIHDTCQNQIYISMRLVTSFFVVLTSILQLAVVRKERAEKWIAEGAIRVVHGILLFPVVLQAQWPDCRGKKKLLSMVRYHEPPLSAPDSRIMSAAFPPVKSVSPSIATTFRFIFSIPSRPFHSCNSLATSNKLSRRAWIGNLARYSMIHD